ncbi:Dynein heavy chain-like protein [Frankliniella fusca]|uniref:Dynein heavy chain-like protein n=1 Tax=Frankliniella fusca TaxID=407009 RepID=A0AAE1LBX4_9NEOP|nr:Dynein heavy chain-like protein [Frankliniella fusca]
MRRQRALRGIAVTLLLALLAGAEARHTHGHVAPSGPSGRTWPCSHAAAQSSPEVLQLLRKTGNAFKQVGDILLKRTGAPCAPAGHAPAPAAPAPVPAPQPHSVPVPGYGYPYPHPYFYYPMAYPSVQPPMYPVHYVPGPYSAQVGAVAQAQQGGAGPAYPAELSNQLVSLASEYEQAAQNECSCGNVEVNMRQGPSSLASGKASDIVVEVTLGDLTQAEHQQQEQEGQEEDEELQQQTKKTVNILNISEASEGGEYEAESSAKASSSASVEEKTIEETDETNTIQVVEAIKLQPETSPLQIETFDNTVAAVEKTIKETVVVKSETEESKTIVSDNGETVINVKTYEESFPKTATQDEEEMFVGGDEEDVVEQDVVEEEAYAPEQPQQKNAYDEKVEVVEVEEETLQELKKEASVVSEMVETVDIEQKETDVTKTVMTETKTVQQTETVSKAQEDVKIIVVDVEANAEKNDTAMQTATGDAQYFEYDYEYVDVTPDCLDKDVKDLQKYFPSSPSLSKSVVPKYVSGAEEKEEGGLKEGEHLLLERPHPVENVQVVIKGTSAQAYAEGLQVHSAAAHNHYQQQHQQQAHSTVHHHHAAAHVPQPAPQPRPKPAVVFDVPCEAHYGIPKRGYRQRQNAEAHGGQFHHDVKSHKMDYYPAPSPQPQPLPQPWPVPVQPAPPCQPEPEPAVCSELQLAQPQQGAVSYKPAPAVYYSRQTPQQPAPQYVARPPVYYERPSSKPAPQQHSPQYIAGPPVYYARPTPQPAPQQPSPQYIVGPPVYFERPTPEPTPQQPSRQYIPKPTPQPSSNQYFSGPPVYYQRSRPQQPSPRYIAGRPVYQARPTPLPAAQPPAPRYQPGPAVYYAPPQQQTVQTKKTTVKQYQSSSAQPAYGSPAPMYQSPASYYQPSGGAITSYRQASKLPTGQGLHHRQQVQPSAQESASRILLGAVQSAAKQSSKLTPAQYPPYYFTAHSDSIYAPPIIKRRPVAKPTVNLAVASVPASASFQDSAKVVPQRYAGEVNYKPATAAVSVPVQTHSTVVEDEFEEQQPAAGAPTVVKVALPAVQQSSDLPAQSHAVPVVEDEFEEAEEESSAPADLVQLPSVKVEKKPVAVGASEDAADQPEEDLFDSESNAWSNGQSDAGEDEDVVEDKFE